MANLLSIDDVFGTAPTPSYPTVGGINPPTPVQPATPEEILANAKRGGGYVPTPDEAKAMSADIGARQPLPQKSSGLLSPDELFGTTPPAPPAPPPPAGETVSAPAYLGSRGVSGISNLAQSLGEAANLEAGMPQENVLKPGEMAGMANKAAFGTAQPQPSNPLLKIPGAAIEGLTSAGPAALANLPVALATAAAPATGEGSRQIAKAAGASPAVQTAAEIGGNILGGAIGGGAPSLYQLLTRRMASIPAPVAASGGNAVRQGVNLLGNTLAPELKYGGTTGQQIQNQISAFPNKPSMLADQSGSMQGLTEQLTHKMGPGKFIIEPALKARDVGAGDRIVSDISDTISNGGSAYTTEKALTTQQRTNAAPLFEKAMAKGPVHSDRLQQFLDDPILQGGLKDGVETQRIEAVAEGKPFDPNAYTLTYDADGNLKFMGTPNMRTLQAAKIGLDNQIEKYRDAFGNLKLDKRGSALVKFTRKFNDELRTLNPDYAAANDAWAGEAASKDALALGQQFRKMRPEQLEEKLAAMTPSEKQFFLQGAADSLITTTETTAATGNEARHLLGNAKIRNQLRPLFSSDEAYDSAIARLAEENRQWQTTNQALANSRSAFRLSGTLVPKPESAVPHLIGAAVAAKTGEPLVGINSLIKALAVHGRKLTGAGPPTPEAEAAAARMLTETDPIRRAAIAKAVIQRATPPIPFRPGIPLATLLAQPSAQRQLGAPQ